MPRAFIDAHSKRTIRGHHCRPCRLLHIRDRTPRVLPPRTNKKRPRRRRAETLEQAEVAVVERLQSHCQQRLQTDNASFRLSERKALRILVAWRVIARHGVYGAIRKTGDDRFTVVLGAQRW